MRSSNKFIKTVERQRNLSMPEAEIYVRKRYEALGSSTKILNELGIDGEEFFVKAFKKIDLNKLVSKDLKIVSLISDLKKKYKVGMISNTHLSIARKKLEALGLSLKVFNPMITTYELNAYKPDPAPFLKALEMAEHLRKNQCILAIALRMILWGLRAWG